MKIEQLTFTRFIAAISIVVYHFAMDLFPFRSNAVSFLFKQANLGVSFFFILSGFVMIIAYGGKGNVPIDTRKFYMNRLARIYPAYLMALLILVVYMYVRSWNYTGTELVLCLLVLQTWIPAYALSLNAPGWSLVVEFFFYALYPLLFNRIYVKAGLYKLIIPVLLVWIGTQVFFNIMINSPFYQGVQSNSHNLLYYFPLMHLNEFLIGNLGGLILLKIKNRGQGNYTGLLFGFAILIVILLRFPLPWSYHDGLLAAVFVPFLIVLSKDRGIISRVFSLKPLIFLGEISYGVYIFQVPVYYWCKGMIKVAGLSNPYAIFYIYLVILIGISGLSYVYIETPIRNRVKNRNLVLLPGTNLKNPDKP
jgi:peptidoglycan/LPS O-acetylase OafA/YrhL